VDPGASTRDHLLIVLTFAAGVVDAVSYLGLGRIFTANMTGNVVFLALAIGEGSLGTALLSVGALVGFSLGAVVAGRVLGRIRPPGTWPRRVTWVLSGELVCLGAFAGVWAVSAGRPASLVLYGLVALSSFAMGMQNAAARHLSVPGLTTTVLTLALTGLMVDLPALGLSGPTQKRAVLGLVALFSGAAIGAWVLLAARTVPPILTAVAVLAVVGIAIARFGGTAAAAG
jgi:uncharacterized membrane protein YoaK (UPF0700 family)